MYVSCTVQFQQVAAMLILESTRAPQQDVAMAARDMLKCRIWPHMVDAHQGAVFLTIFVKITRRHTFSDWQGKSNNILGKQFPIFILSPSSEIKFV
jgi:hypothetical protein